MKDPVLVRTIDDVKDLACVRALLLDALAMLDRSALPDAATVATFVSHALEVLSPGADPFAETKSERANPSL